MGWSHIRNGLFGHERVDWCCPPSILFSEHQRYQISEWISMKIYEVEAGVAFIQAQPHYIYCTNLPCLDMNSFIIPGQFLTFFRCVRKFQAPFFFSNRKKSTDAGCRYGKLEVWLRNLCRSGCKSITRRKICHLGCQQLAQKMLQRKTYGRVFFFSAFFLNSALDPNKILGTPWNRTVPYLN